MEILNAELKNDSIHVEANLDGEKIIRKFDKNKSSEDIKAEFAASEENIKQEKVKKAEYEQKVEDDKEANKTIDNLIS